MEEDEVNKRKLSYILERSHSLRALFNAHLLLGKETKLGLLRLAQ